MLPCSTNKVAVGLALALAVVIALPGCGKKDQEEQFALWSNNEAGFQEMAKFVQSSANDVGARARALEVLMENGQPSQIRRIVQGVEKADRVKVLAKLREDLGKHLKNPNEKIQAHARTVLIDNLELQEGEEADKTRKVVGDWAFAGMSPDDKASTIAQKLGKRISQADIEKLGKYGVKGAEIMLSKGINKPGMLGFLQSVKDPVAKIAMVNGLRRYHAMKGGKVKISNGDLGFLQRTKHLNSLLYFFEIYEKRSDSDHADDEQASSMAIAAAMDWLDKPEGKALIGANWAKAFKPLAARFIKRANCDDRWWAAQVMIQNEGMAGLTAAMSALPDDLNYGNPDHANADVKLKITDFCTQDVSTIKDHAAVHKLWISTLDTERVIERIIAIRCLVADGGDDAAAAMVAYIKKRKKLKEEKIIDPIVVPPEMTDMTLTDLAVVALDSIKYKAENDKLAAAGKITKDQLTWRNKYTEFTFDRKDKKLREWAIGMADNRIKKQALKKASAAKK
jgi:hypothetical protein